MISGYKSGRAFEETAKVLFHLAGENYLIYVDHYNGWPCVPNCARKGIDQMKEWFADWGIPLRIQSDGGPQYKSSEYRKFLEDCGVNEPGLSTPHYPQSNGRAEAAVKAMKKLVSTTTVITSDDFRKGFIKWRNTPKKHGKSPSQLVFGCQ